MAIPDVRSVMLSVRNRARSALMKVRIVYLREVWAHDVHETARVSFSAYLDRTNPKGIRIGAYTIVTRGAMVLSHDFSRSLSSCTSIGANCLVGVNAIIVPGVTIGDEVVIGAGSVVTRDVPSNTLVAGNPARVIAKVRAGPFGKIIEHKPV